MQEVLEQVVGLIRHVWRGRWLALAIAWLICLIGWAVVSMIPDKFESQARLYVDTESLSGPFLPSGYTQANMDARLTLMRQTMLSATNIDRIIGSSGVLPEGTPLDSAAARALADNIRTNIDVQVAERNFFSIRYTDREPRRAQEVVVGLLDVLGQSPQDSSADQMQQAAEFLDEQIETARAQLDTAESRLTDFQERNAAHIGGSDRFYSRLQEAQAQVQKFRGDLALATAERDELERQLRTTPRTVARIGANGEPLTTGRAAELQALRTRLADLQGRYTPQHPDVTATRRAIERLEQDLQDNPGVTADGPNNPTYERLRLQLAQAGANVARARSSLEQAQLAAEKLNGEIDVAPRADAEYRRLSSDVEPAKRNYTQLTQQRDQARIAGEFDAQTKKIEFRVIDPPSLPTAPASPNRALLLAGVLLAGFGIGCALALVIGLINAPFDSPKALHEVFDLRVLGAVSRLHKHGHRVSSMARGAGFVLGCGLLILALGFLIFAERMQIIQPLRSEVSLQQGEAPSA